MDLKDEKIDELKFKKLNFKRVEPFTEEKIDLQWQSLLAKIKQTKGKKHFNIFNIVKAVAAITILIVISSVSIYFLRSTDNNKKEIISNYIIISTLKGEQKEITLPDGSIVKLNSLSKLRYPESFIGENRNIEFDGEAFFRVQHNPQKPFIILSKNIETKVMGTVFNINTADTNNITVSLKQGSVLVKNKSIKNSDFQQLTPGFEAIINKSNNKMEVKHFEEDVRIGWYKNVFAMKNEKVETVLARAAKWFNVEIKMNDSKLKNKYYTGTFKNDSLKGFLNAFCFTFNKKMSIKGNIIEIK